jgi:hypothetical protein
MPQPICPEREIMAVRKPSAGETTEAHCTRCRVPTNHTIVAMVGERIARVECNTCGGVHNYRGVIPPAVAKAAKVAKVAKSKATKESTPRRPASERAGEREWLSVREAVAARPAIPYQMTGRYQVDDVVMHPSFGPGLVREVIKPGKMEVLFEQGKKLLRCLT